MSCSGIPIESLKNDDTPWCAAFVNWCIAQTHINPNNKTNAQVWKYWGRRVEKPFWGCVAALQNDPDHKENDGRDNWHVAFYIRSNEKTITLLGGNQNNEVNISVYDANKFKPPEYRFLN